MFRFLNWYGMFRPFRAERNGIDNLGANTFPNHNQSLTRESLTRPVHPDFLVTLNEILGGNSQRIKQSNKMKNHPTDAAQVTCDTNSYNVE